MPILNRANRRRILLAVGLICISIIGVALTAVGFAISNFRHDNAILSELSNQAIEVTWNLTGRVSAATVYPSDPPFDDHQLKILSRLNCITRLTLHGTAVTDDGIGCIVELPRLQWLDVSRTHISDAGIAKLYGVNNPLTILALESNVTTDGASAASSQTGSRLKIVI